MRKILFIVLKINAIKKSKHSKKKKKKTTFRKNGLPISLSQTCGQKKKIIIRAKPVDKLAHVTSQTYKHGIRTKVLHSFNSETEFKT